MKILLIGKNGQVGWELRRTLAPLAEVVAVDYPEINLTDAPALRQFVAETRPSVVVNAAAYTAVDKAETETELCRQINAVAPGVLAEEAKKTGRAAGALLDGLYFRRGEDVALRRNRRAESAGRLRAVEIGRRPRR